MGSACRHRPHVRRREPAQRARERAPRAPPASRPEHGRTGRRCLGRGPVPRPVVDDDHLVGEPAERGDAGADPPGLVVRRDERDDSSLTGGERSRDPSRGSDGTEGFGRREASGADGG